MGLKKVENIQKYSGKRKTPDEENNINSKENVEKIEDAKDETTELPPIMQIDYDELPDGVYDFAGLAELQNRKTKPNFRENEKLLRNKSKKEKKNRQKSHKKRNRLIPMEDKEVEETKNIVEEIFEAKKNSEERTFKSNSIVEEEFKLEKEEDFSMEAPAKTDEIEEVKAENLKEEFEEETKIAIAEKQNSNEERFELPDNKSKIEEKNQALNLDKKTEEITKVEENSKLTSFENKIENSTIDTEDKPKAVIVEENKELIEENAINIPDIELKNFEKKNENSGKRKGRARAKKTHIELINEEEEPETDFTNKINSWCTSNKKFAFFIMFFLGVITQISFLATSRENNLMGLFSIALLAISMFLLINVLEIKNKILIFAISLVLVLIPQYTEIFIIGENSIMNSFSILLALFSLNLVFVKKNRIISFVVAVTMFGIAYKIFQDCMQVILIVSIIKILKDIFNKKETILNFLLHCMMICAILSVVIFL